MFPLGSRWMKLGVLAAAAATVSGCGGDTAKKAVIGKVGGLVTLDGEPVKAGSVLTFFPQSAGAEIGSGLIRDDGTYVATSGEYPGIPIGEYRVAVAPPMMDPEDEEALAKKNVEIAMNAMSRKRSTKENLKELEKLEYPQDAIVPRKYWADSTSRLKFTVNEGENTANFELSSGTAK